MTTNVLVARAELAQAEAAERAERRQKLVAAQIFSAQYPVGVEDPDLDVLDAALDQKIADFDVLLQGV